MFATVANGGTTMQLAREFTAEGIPTPTGLDAPWRATAIGKMLHHERYKGMAYAFRSKATQVRSTKRNGTVAKITRNVDVPESERVALPEGTIPPLVSPVIFERVQAQLLANKSRSSRNNHDAEAFLLRGGFVRCGHCGRVIQAATDRTQGRVAPWRHYRANSEHQRRYGCGNVSISAATLDRDVESKLRLILEDPAFVQQFIQPVVEAGMATAAPLESLRKAIADRKARTIKLLGSLEFLEGDEAVHVRARLATLASERKALEAQATELEATSTEASHRQSEIDKLLATLEFARSFNDSLTYAQKRQWLDALGFTAHVWGKSHSPRYEIRAAIDPGAWAEWEHGQLGEDPTAPWPEQMIATPIGRFPMCRARW
jgi:site-specific DNA recombinase